MQDINEINGQPEEVNEHESTPKGTEIYLGQEDIDFLTEVGREITEAWLQESFLLYRIDLAKTQVNVYGESKYKVYKPSIELYGRINVETQSPTYQTEGGITKKGMGDMSAHVFLDHLDERGLVFKKEGQYIGLDLKVGDYIMFKGQYYQIKDDGFSQISNQFSYGGDRRFSLTIKAIEIDEDQFKAR